MIPFTIFIIVLFNPTFVNGGLFEPGFVDSKFMLDSKTLDKTVSLGKSMYKGSDIMFKINCQTLSKIKFRLKINISYDECHKSLPANIEIYSKELKCSNHIIIDPEILKKIVIQPGDVIPKNVKEDNQSAKAGDSGVKSESKPKIIPSLKTVNKNDTALSKKNIRRRREETEKSATTTTTTIAPTTLKLVPHTAKVGINHLPLTLMRGFYDISITFQVDDIPLERENKLEFSVYIESTHDGSYLSVINWPLLPFFGFMSLLYLAYAIGWFIVSCCNWKDLLRVQFWIGGVIAIGMFENALFYAEYQNISHTGSENGLLYFAELISCAKRALARILVVIVSMGFGIVKPRLGQTLHKVLAVGTLYFVVASIEGCIRVHAGGPMRSKAQTYSLIPVTLLDVGLSWWVFTSLVQTTRTLRIRKNLVKLTLYRHFTNALIFTIIASLAYMVWTIKEANFTKCMDLSSIWLQDALWPFLFALILAVVMVLWRPSINNQRYAFTPLDLGNSDDDEDEDMTFSDAFGMKMRNKSDTTVPEDANKSRYKTEDDLKWVEENIPSVPSTLLPTLDSDEEILTTKFELSKMD